MFWNKAPLSILVIEDNPADFILLRECLDSSSIKSQKLVCAPDLNKARASLSEDQFDIIFLDLSLPDAIPNETFRMIKPHIQDTPVIVLSGINATEIALQGLQDGAQDYLIKDNLQPIILEKSVHFSIERTKYMRRMLESEKRLRHLALHFPKGIIAILNKDLKYVFACGDGLSGFDIDPEEAAGTLFTDSFSKAEAERIGSLLRSAFDRDTVSFELSNKNQHYLVNAIQIRDESLVEEELMVMLQNITGVKQTSEQLLFQSQVLSSITDCIIACDESGKIVFWNKAATETFGYSTEEITGCDIGMLAHEKQDVFLVSQIIDFITRHGSYERIVRLRNKNKELIWLELKISCNYNIQGEVCGLIYVMKDVTERKAEEYLLRLFESVIHNTHDAVIILEAWPDPVEKMRKIVYVNQAFVKMTGYQPDEVVGKTPRMLFGEVTEKKEMARLTKAMNNWESAEVDLTYYRKDGTIICAKMFLTPVSDNSGSFTHWVLTQTDNTELISIAEKLRRQNEELTRINQDLDRFVYSASHDLRAPLTSILGLINLMRDPKNTAPAELFLGKMQQSVVRLDRLIQNIISYSRNSRTSVKSLEIDFAEQIRTGISMLEFIKTESDFNYDFRNELHAPFRSDPDRWQIILNNLLSNSLKFVHPDRKLEILIRISRSEKQVVFVYEDNGCGIAPERLPFIFEMFYRASETAQGSGLGLYIVKQAVTMLGGSIRAESFINEFTRFIITLPDQEQSHAEKSR